MVWHAVIDIIMLAIKNKVVLLRVLKKKKGTKTSHHGPDIVGYRRAAYT
jgi:hypothetical protein